MNIYFFHGNLQYEVLFVLSRVTKKMPLIFSLAKPFSSAFRTFCNSRIAKMDRDIYLIPFRLELGFAFRADIRLGNHNEIQSNKQNKYRNNYKIPRNIEMASKPIDPTGSKQKSRGEQKQRNKYFFHYNTAFLILL